MEVKGSVGPTLTVSMEPDRSGNYVCTGAADDVDINRALSDLSSLGGGSLHIKAGTYDITATLTVAANNIQIQGDGQATILALATASNTHVITVGGTFWTIRDLKIDGNAVDQGAGPYYGIYANNKTNGLIDNVYLNDCDQAGVHIDGGSNMWRVISSTFIGNYKRAMQIHSSTTYGILIANCTFRNNSANAGTADPDISIWNGPHHISVENCYFENSGYATVYIFGEGGSPPHDVSVVGCTSNTTVDGGAFRCGFGAYNIVFSGNNIYNSSYHSLHATGCHNVTISGNSVNLSGGESIGIGTEDTDGGYECYAINIVGNTIYNPGQTDWKSAIVLHGDTDLDCYDVTIDGNTLWDDRDNNIAALGINLSGTGGNVDRIIISDNIMSGFVSAGVSFAANSGCDDCVISGNIITLCGIGLRMDDGDDATISHNRIKVTGAAIDINNAACVSTFIDGNNLEGSGSGVLGWGVATTPMFGNNVNAAGTITRDVVPP
jgi:hypothetical protein